MKSAENPPTTTQCTATRVRTTDHHDATGACIGSTECETTVNVTLHTTALPPTDARILTLHMACSILDATS